MKRSRVVVAALAAALLGIVSWLLVRSSSPPERADATLAREGGDTVIREADPASDGAAAIDGAEVSAHRRSVGDEPLGVPNAAEPSSADVCEFVGRVVDVRGVPIADAAVRMQLMYVPTADLDAWFPDDDECEADADDEEDVDLDPVEHYFDVRTGADGTFALHTPAPTAPGGYMSVQAGLWYTRNHVDLDPRYEGIAPPFEPGRHDLGDQVLLDTGTIAGRVLDARGAPAANVALTAWMGQDRREGTWSDVDGTYRISSLLPATYEVAAIDAREDDDQRPALSRARRSHVVVKAGEVTRDVDFVLEDARVLTVIVVDREGEPLARARAIVYDESGFVSIEYSRNDGSFRWQLDTESASNKLEFEHDDTIDRTLTVADFERLPLAPDGQARILTLAPRPLITFEVTSATNGAPLSDVELGLGFDTGDVVDDPQARQAGRVAFRARGTRSIDYTLRAPGHRAHSGEIDVATDGLVVPVALERAGSIAGRVTWNGEPWTRTGVHVVWADKPDEDAYWPPDVADYIDRIIDPAEQSDVVLDTDGRFHVDNLPAARWRIDVATSDGDVFASHTVDHDGASHVDVGEIALPPSGRVTGRVVHAPGSSGAFTRVFLGDQWSGEAAFFATTDSESAFAIDVPALPLHVGLAAEDPFIDGPLQLVDVRAGETTHVEIDATHYLPCQVEIVVRSAGAPLAGVWAVRPREIWRSEPTGSDTNGRLGITPHGGPSESWWFLDATTRVFLGARELPPIVFGAPNRFDVELELGALEFRAPAERSSATTEPLESFTTCDGLDVERHLFPRGLAFDAEGRAHIDRLAAGTYPLRRHVDGRLFDATFTVEPGKTAVLTPVE